MTQEITAIPKHISTFLGSTDLVPINDLMALPSEERLKHASVGLKLRLAGSLYAGYALAGLKEELGHGSYLSGLASLNIAPRTASRCINLAKLASRTDEAKFAKLADLNASKLEFLIKWDDEEIQAFCQGEEVRGITLESTLEQPARDIQKQLKDYEQSNDALAIELDEVNSKNRLLQEKLDLLKRKQNEPTGFIYPEAIERIRIESSALALQAARLIDDIDHLSTLLIDCDADSDDVAEQNKHEADLHAGGSTLHLNLLLIQGKISAALNNYSNLHGQAYVTTQLEDTPLLTPEEAATVSNMHAVMVAEIEVSKDLT